MQRSAEWRASWRRVGEFRAKTEFRLSLTPAEPLFGCRGERRQGQRNHLRNRADEVDLVWLRTDSGTRWAANNFCLTPPIDSTCPAV